MELISNDRSFNMRRWEDYINHIQMIVDLKLWSVMYPLKMGS